MKAIMPIGLALEFKTLADNADMLQFLKTLGRSNIWPPPATRPPRRWSNCSPTYRRPRIFRTIHTHQYQWPVRLRCYPRL